MLGFKDLVEGEKYIDMASGMNYTKKYGALWVTDLGHWSNLTMSDIREIEFKKVPWKPKLNESYFIIDMTYECGYIEYNNTNSLVDMRMIKYDEVFKTEEEVIKYRNTLEWWKNEVHEC